MKLTPYVRALVIHRMSVIAIPNGGGLETGIEFLSSKENILGGLRAACSWVEEALELIRKAPEPNPWKKSSNEDIAKEILRRAGKL